MMKHDFDVIVVGAGPAGLTASLLLARAGHGVALLERWPQPYPQPRAIGLDHEARRIFHQAGADERINEVIEWSADTTEAQYLSAEGEVLLHMPFQARAESGWPDLAGFNQPDIEKFLEELVVESPRIKLMRNVIVNGLEQNSESACVQYVTGDGHGQPAPEAPTHTLSAKYVIGADGAHSVVASQIGAEVTDLGFSSDWLVIDIRTNIPRKWTPNLAQVLDPARPTTVSPGGPGRRRFEFMLIPGETLESMATPEAAWKLLAKWDVTPENSTLVRSSPYRFRARWANNWRKDRVFIAGDAAHLTPPFLGQGFNSAVRDAANLAQYLNLVLDGRVPATVLDYYTEERLHHVKPMIEMAVQLGLQICITDPEQARLRDDHLRAIRDSSPVITPRTPLTNGLVLDGDPLAGTLSHQGRVEYNAARGWFDDVCTSGCFVLIGLDADPAATLGETARAVWTRLGGKSFHVGSAQLQDLEGVYQRWLSAAGARIVLIRPDYYVFGSGGAAADADRLVLALAKKLGASLPVIPAEARRLS